jgi:hypothetical protein|tara:strand:- start:253 stop:474 length:222 start_codon:yes stop_codon:yes gene_type:complete
MKYVCPECGSSEVSCVVDCVIDPNSQDFERYLDGHVECAIENRSFNDSCDDCGWQQDGDDEGLVEKDGTNEAK